MESLWQSTWQGTDFPTLQGDTDTDVLIIGGGLAGVLCAYMLQQSGEDYMLVEAKTIGMGVTGCTTAKITAQHGLIYQKLVDEFGWDHAQAYYQANREAQSIYAELCKKANCEYEEKPSYVYSTENLPKLKREARILEKLGAPVKLVKKTELPLPVAGALRMENQAQFHPLKFLSAISENLHIYEHTPVRQLEGTTAVTDHGKIKAKRIVVATHFPIINKHGSYFLKMYQHRSYVIALEGAPRLEGMYVDEKKSGMSFRSYGDLLLLGGGGHRTGTKGGGWQPLREFARSHYPHCREVYHWATQDCMTLDGVPYIGPYSAQTQGLYVATGFNKWGMTSSMMAAGVLLDLLQGRGSAYTWLFNPSRSILRPQLASNAAHAFAGWLTPTAHRCPHLGCALKWNSQEHTWDCSCHGSRFTEDGKLLDNPATGNMEM